MGTLYLWEQEGIAPPNRGREKIPDGNENQNLTPPLVKENKNLKPPSRS